MSNELNLNMYGLNSPYTLANANLIASTTHNSAQAKYYDAKGHIKRQMYQDTFIPSTSLPVFLPRPSSGEFEKKDRYAVITGSIPVSQKENLNVSYFTALSSRQSTISASSKSHCFSLVHPEIEDHMTNQGYRFVKDIAAEQNSPDLADNVSRFSSQPSVLTNPASHINTSVDAHLPHYIEHECSVDNSASSLQTKPKFRLSASIIGERQTGPSNILGKVQPRHSFPSILSTKTLPLTSDTPKDVAGDSSNDTEVFCPDTSSDEKQSHGKLRFLDAYSQRRDVLSDSKYTPSVIETSLSNSEPIFNFFSSEDIINTVSREDVEVIRHQMVVKGDKNLLDRYRKMTRFLNAHLNTAFGLLTVMDMKPDPGAFCTVSRLVDTLLRIRFNEDKLAWKRDRLQSKSYDAKSGTSSLTTRHYTLLQYRTPFTDPINVLFGKKRFSLYHGFCESSDNLSNESNSILAVVLGCLLIAKKLDGVQVGKEYSILDYAVEQGIQEERIREIERCLLGFPPIPYPSFSTKSRASFESTGQSERESVLSDNGSREKNGLSNPTPYLAFRILPSNLFLLSQRLLDLFQKTIELHFELTKTTYEKAKKELGLEQNLLYEDKLEMTQNASGDFLTHDLNVNIPPILSASDSRYIIHPNSLLPEHDLSYLMDSLNISTMVENGLQHQHSSDEHNRGFGSTENLLAKQLLLSPVPSIHPVSRTNSRLFSSSALYSHCDTENDLTNARLSPILERVQRAREAFHVATYARDIFPEIVGIIDYLCALSAYMPNTRTLRSNALAVAIMSIALMAVNLPCWSLELHLYSYVNLKSVSFSMKEIIASEKYPFCLPDAVSSNEAEVFNSPDETIDIVAKYYYMQHPLYPARRVRELLADPAFSHDVIMKNIDFFKNVPFIGFL